MFRLQNFMPLKLWGNKIANVAVMQALPITPMSSVERFVPALEMDVKLLRSSNKVTIEWSDGSVLGEPVMVGLFTD